MLGGLVHAPMNCTTFLCRTFLKVPKNPVRERERTILHDESTTVNFMALFDLPHYKDFLGKLSLHIRIYSLSLEDFNGHFLTTIRTFISDLIQKEKESVNRKSTKRMLRQEHTSPNSA